jgi:hypothetical protein
VNFSIITKVLLLVCAFITDQLHSLLLLAGMATINAAVYLHSFTWGLGVTGVFLILIAVLLDREGRE